MRPELTRIMKSIRYGEEMKIETRNQLLGFIVGAAIALGVSLMPGLSGQTKMWVILVCILVILRVFKLPGVIKLFAKKIKEGAPGQVPPGRTGGSAEAGAHNKHS